VTTATPGTAGFLTDRGQQELPAWEVHARGVPEPIWVLDPATSQQAWRPPGPEEHELTGDTARAHLGADGRTITLSFTGIPRAYADYPRADGAAPDSDVTAGIHRKREAVIVAWACRPRSPSGIDQLAVLPAL
jgi:hypothetical protein